MINLVLGLIFLAVSVVCYIVSTVRQEVYKKDNIVNDILIFITLVSSITAMILFFRVH